MNLQKRLLGVRCRMSLDFTLEVNLCGALNKVNKSESVEADAYDHPPNENHRCFSGLQSTS